MGRVDRQPVSCVRGGDWWFHSPLSLVGTRATAAAAALINWRQFRCTIYATVMMVNGDVDDDDETPQTMTYGEGTRRPGGFPQQL